MKCPICGKELQNNQFNYCTDKYHNVNITLGNDGNWAIVEINFLGLFIYKNNYYFKDYDFKKDFEETEMVISGISDIYKKLVENGKGKGNNLIKNYNELKEIKLDMESNV